MLGFILKISGNCTDPGLAAIIAGMKKFMNILWILGPILAILGAAIALFRMMSNPDEKKHKSLLKNMLIALIVLFMLPAIVNGVMQLLDGNFEIASCWNQAEIMNEVGSQNSHYIDPNKGDKTQITTDPDKFKGQTGTRPTDKNVNSDGKYAASYYRNEKSRIRYNVYYQNDSKWGSVKYPNGSTINEIGCMISSIAVVVSANDPSVTPKTVFDSGHRHSYPRNAINSLSNGAFNCAAGSTSAAAIKNALAGGKAVVIKVYGSKKGGSSSFTTSQHYMALLGYSDNKIFVGNGYSTSGSGLAGWFDANKVLTSVQEADYCTPTQTLLDKY